MIWRVLVVVLGALPATALGVVAFMGVILGTHVFSQDKISSALSFLWGGFGIAGVTGLWLIAFGAATRAAIPLTICGVIATAPLVVMGLVTAFIGEPSWLLLTTLPFAIAVTCVVLAIQKRRTWRVAVDCEQPGR